MYDEALTEPDPDKLELLHKRLDRSPAAILSLGLGRAWPQGDDPVERHYLQLNNIHLEGYPEWQLSPP